MKVTVNMLSYYLSVHRNTARRHYQTYLDLLDLKRKYLLITDIARVDSIDAEIVAELMGVKDKTHLNALKRIGLN